MVKLCCTVQVWRLSAASAASRRLQWHTAEAHHAASLTCRAWQLWNAYTASKRCTRNNQVRQVVVAQNTLLLTVAGLAVSVDASVCGACTLKLHP